MTSPASSAPRLNGVNALAEVLIGRDGAPVWRSDRVRREALFAPSVTKRLIADFARQQQQQLPGAAQAEAVLLAELTPREQEVLTLIARGLSNAEISTALVIAEQTTKTHVGRILMKLCLRDRAQAVVLAYESGLVTPGD
jgi:DNA-binding NarL/FixJ family response regulator